MNKKFRLRTVLVFLLNFLLPLILFAQTDSAFSAPGGNGLGELILMILLLVTTLAAATYLAFKTLAIKNRMKKDNAPNKEIDLEKFINSLDKNEIDTYLNYRQMKKPTDNDGKLNSPLLTLFLAAVGIFLSRSAFAQTAPNKTALFNEGGIIITLILILTPILAGIILMIVKVSNLSRKYKLKRNLAEAERISDYLKTLPGEDVTDILKKRKEVLDFKISQSALSGTLPVSDKKGILKNVNEHANIRFIEEKRKAIQRPGVDPQAFKAGDLVFNFRNRVAGFWNYCWRI